MAYFLNLFSPQTYIAFSNSQRDVTGFRDSQLKAAKRVSPGDLFICYVTRLSRWIGILRVLDGPFHDETPVFLPEDDPFTTRFHVEPIVWLDPEYSIPIHHPEVWQSLSFTREHDPSSSRWTGTIRSSLKQLEDADGQFVENALLQQNEQHVAHELEDRDRRRLSPFLVRRPEGAVAVTVPDDDEEVNEAPQGEIRESYRIQALLAEIGAQMGHKVWLPMADRSAVKQLWSPEPGDLLESLPLNYDETTLKTIERIDVLWLRRRSIVRAFEIEHTTAIYSGILRMADLLALQPNMDIRLHIVAPEVRREKVFDQISRPVFTLLEKGPLAKLCTFIPYDAVHEVHQLKHLSHYSDTVLDEYAEGAE